MVCCQLIRQPSLGFKIYITPGYSNIHTYCRDMSMAQPVSDLMAEDLLDELTRRQEMDPPR